MVGNDVVDLGDPETRPGARHPRFDARVFAADELAALRASGAPERLRWMLWAAKEAAYKVARKLDPRTVFSPPRFAVQLEASGAGAVRHPGGLLPVRIEVAADRVHAIARSGGGAALQSGVLAIAPDACASPGAAVRREVVLRVAHRIGASPAELVIEKQGRIPFVSRGGLRLPVDLSLSHHGRYAAWAFELHPSAEGSA